MAGEAGMTARYDALVVILDHDMRDDDAASTIEAIRHIVGVISVEPHGADPVGEMAGVARERTRWVQGIRKILESNEA